MVAIILHGCGGAMGKTVAQIADADEEVKIVAGVDPAGQGQCAFPVYASLEECRETGDVIVDFSSAKAVDALLDYSAAKQIPVVLCSTGLSEAQVEKVKKTGEQIALLRSANMSLGVNLLLKLVQDAAKTLAAADFDIEIVEKHHNQKIDAPSGTALALADSVNQALGDAYHYEYDRASKREKRDKKEIGIQSVRGGSIVGEHDVIFAGKDEVVTFSHTAYSKAIFAKGAVSAAKFLAHQKPGLYTMADVIG